jgi:ribosome-associated toxin RatA of RatAB toxin-antitoxin module
VGGKQLSCQFVQKTDKALSRAAQMPHSPEGLFLLVWDVTSFSGNMMFCAPQFVALRKLRSHNSRRTYREINF